MPTRGRDQVSRCPGTWAEGQAGEGLGLLLKAISPALKLGREQPGRRGPAFPSGVPSAPET